MNKIYNNISSQKLRCITKYRTVSILYVGHAINAQNERWTLAYKKTAFCVC